LKDKLRASEVDKSGIKADAEARLRQSQEEGRQREENLKTKLAHEALNRLQDLELKCRAD